MNGMQAKRIVVLSMVGSAIIVIASKTVTEHGFPTDPRLYIAGAFIYILLGFAAEFAPQVAGPFAILVLVAILLYEGAPAFAGVTAALNRKGRKR